MPTGCAFDRIRNEENGVYVLTYTPDTALRPDTVAASAFSAGVGDRETNIKNIIYYPDKNLIKLMFSDKLYLKRVDVDSAGLKSMNDRDVSINLSDYPHCETEAEYDGLSIIGKGFYQNGEPIISLKDKINVEIRAWVSNTSSGKQSGSLYILSDGKIISSRSFDIGAFSASELCFSIKNHVFESSNIEFVFGG